MRTSEDLIEFTYSKVKNLLIPLIPGYETMGLHVAPPNGQVIPNRRSAKAYLSAVNRMLAADEEASLPAVGTTPD